MRDIPLARESGADSAPEGQDYSDRTLLRRWVSTGCQDAATQLYERYAPRLRALARTRCSPMVARQLDPDDIVQSIFRRFYDRVGEGDYHVPEGEDLWKLFLVITLNRIRTAERFYRADKRDQSITVGETGLDNEHSGEAAEGFLQVVVGEILERLPLRHRQVVQLRLAGFEMAEIAAQLGRSLRTVERLLQECRAKLEVFFDAPV